MRITDRKKAFAAVVICVFIAAVSLTGGILAQRRVNIPEIEVIDIAGTEASAQTIAVSATETAAETEHSGDDNDVTSTSSAYEVLTDAAININTASAEELMSLKGIGEKTAAAIIEYRENTPFESTEDIMNVKGIGEKKYENIKDSICV